MLLPKVIVDHGLGEKGEQNLELAQQACNALLKIVPAKLKQDDPDPPFKFKVLMVLDKVEEGEG